MKNMAAVILAAGKGTRMNSDLPKVLHKVAGQPMLKTVCDTAAGAADAGICIVIGAGAEQVRKTMGDTYMYALQAEQLGTGHALMQALPALNPLPETLMVLCGDTPLLTEETLLSLKDYFIRSGAACTVMSAMLPTAGSYGRIVRDGYGKLEGIVEARDATPEQLLIREVNSGVYCFRSAALKEALAAIQPNNAQGEYYLTDALEIIRKNGGLVNAYICRNADEISGVNDRVQLAEADAVLRKRINSRLLKSGVTMIDPAAVYVDAGVEIGHDTILEPQVFIHGNTKIGAGCHIGPCVKIVDSSIGDGCEIGPFAYLRPGTQLGNKVKAGHFVEIKRSNIGDESKVPHLSYIGDSDIGSRVNIGCGTITCNYDGKEKHRTIIGNDVFVGSNTNFVAPVRVGERSTIAAGSTITNDVPDNSLGVARGRQRNIEGWTEKSDPRFRRKE